MCLISDCFLICFFFFFNDTATTEIYTLSLHDALPIYRAAAEQPVEALASSVLPQMSADLQGLLEIIDRVNDDEMDDPILYAVSYLLRAAKRFSDAAPQA